MANPRRIYRTRTRATRGRSSVMGAESARKSRERMRQLINKHKGRCAICGEPVTMRDGDPRRATVDHVLPIARGGLDVPANWQLACHECNQAKGAA